MYLVSNQVIGLFRPRTEQVSHICQLICHIAQVRTRGISACSVRVWGAVTKPLQADSGLVPDLLRLKPCLVLLLRLLALHRHSQPAHLLPHPKACQRR